MAKLSVIDDQLVVALTLGEKLAALHGDVRIPISLISYVDVVLDPLAHVHGFRAPGLSLPGRVQIGTWRRRHGNRTFVVARRGAPAIRVRISNGPFDELLISDDHAQEVADRLRST